MAEKKYDKPFKYNLPPDAKAVQCKYCKAQTFWVENKNGKWIMVDPDGICHWEEGRCVR